MKYKFIALEFYWDLLLLHFRRTFHRTFLNRTFLIRKLRFYVAFIFVDTCFSFLCAYDFWDTCFPCMRFLFWSGHRANHFLRACDFWDTCIACVRFLFWFRNRVTRCTSAYDFWGTHFLYGRTFFRAFSGTGRCAIHLLGYFKK